MGLLKRKRPPCSKQDLENIVRLLYTSDSAKTIYADAALVVMMWYLYGRSSDAEQLEKQQFLILPGGVLFIRFKRVKTALLQGISLFKDPSSYLTCPLFAFSCRSDHAKRTVQTFVSSVSDNRAHAANVGDVKELSLVELLEAGEDHTPFEDAQQSAVSRSVPGAQAHMNRLLVRVKQFADQKQVKLTHGLTPHSFRRGAAMHANDGSLAEDWIIEQGGWQLDRVNKAFGYMLGATQAGQNVARVLSGWRPKEGARLPSLRALEYPVLARTEKLRPCYSRTRWALQIML
ncbi:hypothetical protein PC110_g14580 [Phytophthora cactorum]|uniref:Tyr recombinase domain-containing protein n=1 Tax=Phytophthora cactorum TaxID=29920 RepID=A0A329S045_9STRA|nr:hypothetical protein PC110_g14580 [Phytophthora cactorum]